jgi:hypothetical protein
MKAMRILLAASLLLSACNDGSYQYIGPAQGAQAIVQVLNASPDAPPMTLLIDGNAAATSLGYGQGTSEFTVDPTATHTVTLQGLAPSTPTTLINLSSQTFKAGTVYRIVADGPVASIAPVTYTYQAATTAANSTRIQLIHAAPTAGGVAIYLTAPGAPLASSTPVATLDYQQASGPSSMLAGTYEIRITPAGSSAPVLYDSGALTFVPGVNLLIAAVENVGLGTSPVQLVAVDEDGNNSLLTDASTPAALRVVHDVADGPAVSVYAAGSTTPLVSSLTYGKASSYLPVTPQVLEVSVTPMSNPAQALLALPVDLDPGKLRTVYAIGPLASVSPLVTHDHTRRVATYAKLRVIHGAPSAALVDVYIVPTGTALSAASPTYAAVPFGADTDFQPFAAGTYQLSITTAGTKTVLLGPVTLTLKNSGLYTAVARDAPGGGAPLGVIGLDDL